MNKVFVLGKHRSGTTWLANIISRHSDVASICHEMHFGIHESGFFSHAKPFFGDIRNIPEYLAFLEAFFASDYAKLSGVDINYFYENQLFDYYQFFDKFMELHAISENKTSWLEKSPRHTLLVHEINAHIENAKFIYVKRNIFEVIESSINHHDNIQSINIIRMLRLIVAIISYDKTAMNYAKTHNNIMTIKYCDVLNRREDVVKELCEFIDIRFEDALLEDFYKADSSFKEEKEKMRLSEYQKKYLSIFIGFVKLLPYRIFKLMEIWLTHRKKRKGRNTLPPWFYRMTIREHHMADGVVRY